MIEQPIFGNPESEHDQSLSERGIEEMLLEKRRKLESLALELGFEETPEVASLRESIATSEGVSTERLIEWRGTAETLVESLPSDDFVRGQLGLLLLKATVYLDAKMPDEFYEDLDDAIEYALNAGVDLGDTVEVLRGL